MMKKQEKRKQRDAAFISKMSEKKGKKRMRNIKHRTIDDIVPTPAEVQLDVSPKEGMAVVFFPPDPKSRHEGRPVISHKWIAQQWIRIDPIPDGTTPPPASGKR